MELFDESIPTQKSAGRTRDVFFGESRCDLVCCCDGVAEVLTECHRESNDDDCD